MAIRAFLAIFAVIAFLCATAAETTRHRSRQFSLYEDMHVADVAAHGADSSALPYLKDGRIDLLLMVQPNAMAGLLEELSSQHARLLFVDRPIGYLRANVSLTEWQRLRADARVDAVLPDDTNHLELWIDYEAPAATDPPPPTPSISAPAAPQPTPPSDHDRDMAGSDG